MSGAIRLSQSIQYSLDFVRGYMRRIEGSKDARLLAYLNIPRWLGDEHAIVVLFAMKSKPK